MLVLAITTSTDEGGVALAKNGKILGHKIWTRGGQHSEVLTLNIKRVLERAKVLPSKLDVIAVDRGPGSFTGCRIAVNVARTLAYSLSIPIFSGYSLDIIAEAIGRGALKKRLLPFLTLLNAHKSLTYARQYEYDGKLLVPITEVNAWSLDEILSRLQPGTKVFGDLDKVIKRTLKENGGILSARKKLCFPQADILALMVDDNSQFLNWSKVEPAYIRVPEAVEKLMSK